MCQLSSTTRNHTLSDYKRTLATATVSFRSVSENSGGPLALPPPSARSPFPRDRGQSHRDSSLPRHARPAREYLFKQPVPREIQNAGNEPVQKKYRLLRPLSEQLPSNRIGAEIVIACILCRLYSAVGVREALNRQLAFDNFEISTALNSFEIRQTAIEEHIKQLLSATRPWCNMVVAIQRENGIGPDRYRYHSYMTEYFEQKPCEVVSIRTRIHFNEDLWLEQFI
ncbi:hypothetical protein EVAR_60277_1 [Eumeta japonica]|uniref:Uncharacterized protein n=1 Tax=Eumeta variegata TaxID=151549 RepID=A0A4C1Z9Z8_EUMVA|nr:hypothetical protein EVAR_60277_1 [Eumeta japonica]